MKNEISISLPTAKDVGLGIMNSPLSVLKKFGLSASNVDTALVTGANQKKKSLYATTKIDGSLHVDCINEFGKPINMASYCRKVSIRPIIESDYLYRQLFLKREELCDGVDVVSFGEFPQTAVSREQQRILEKKYVEQGLFETGKEYVFDKVNSSKDTDDFDPLYVKEYELDGKKYVRLLLNNNPIELSNEVIYKTGDPVWLEVEPIIWLIDSRSKKLISLACLTAGVMVQSRSELFNKDYNKTAINKYLNEYMLYNMFSNTFLYEDSVQRLLKK